ncbi:MAG: MBL fold metallo-hydrolase [Nitrosopumilaceae archaeon]
MVEQELIFKQIRRQDSGCVTYLIGSSKTRECIIVDPLLDTDYIVQEAKDSGFNKITHVIDTHTHADHVSGSRNLVKQFNLNGVIMHSNSKCNFKTIPVEDGQIIIGDTKLQFLYTPGHTYDHVCILIDDTKVLTGDTMLIWDVGRIDLGGDPRDKAEKLYDSLHGKLMKLDDAVEVYPTHVGAAHHLGNSSTFSTIGKERQENMALKTKNKDDFYKYMTEDWPPKPPDYQNIIRLNRGEVSIT